MKRSVWVGFDPREVDGYAVTRASARRHLSPDVQIHGLVLDELRRRGLYRRPTSRQDGRLWDDISEAPMSTEFAISRFLVPHLAGEGWALFMDADMLVRASLDGLFAIAEASPDKAVLCVKHDHQPSESEKMDGQVQTRYVRKNWSSVMMLNASHEANRALTVEMVNTLPGRDLHALKWLDDDLIGALDESWNWLEGYSSPDIDPRIVHFTRGIPSMPGYEDATGAEEWRAELERWAA